MVALTSNVGPRNFSFTITSDDLEEGSLKIISMIRVDKIYTLNKSIVVKTFGRVTPEILTKIKDVFLKLIDQLNITN